MSVTGTLVANEDGSFSRSYIFYVTTTSVVYNFYSEQEEFTITLERSSPPLTLEQLHIQ